MQLFEYIDMPNTPYDFSVAARPDAKLNWHYYSEILYVRKGSVRVACNNASAVLDEGDLCYIYPLQLHAVFDNGALGEYAVLKFDLHTINLPQSYLSKMYEVFLGQNREEDFMLVLKRDQGNVETVSLLTERLLNEFQQKKEFYSMQIQSDLHTLLIEIARNVSVPDSGHNGGQSDTDSLFFHILEYIVFHSAEPLEAEKLADMCHMSYSHFAKRFRESYGRSCKEYITYIRLNKAQDLLLHTDYDLTRIAMETGFYDCSHFIRTYKKWKGITPNKQRKEFLTYL